MRDYIHIHAAPRRKDQPTLVLLHGTGGDETSFADLGRLIAPEAGLLSLRGDVDEFGHARFFRRKAEGVYDMDDLAVRTRKLARFLNDRLDALGIDREHAIGIGYSNGANILANLLAEEPTVLRRMVLMHPLIPFDLPDTPGIAGAQVLITAGAQDPIAPRPVTEALADRLATLGAEVTLAMHPGGHEIRSEEIDAARPFIYRGQTRNAA